MLIHRTRGFSIVELMIGLVLLGVILMLALPSFIGMVNNMRVRNAAESVLTGLQQARVTALQRNLRAEFLLMNEAADPSNVAAYVANTSGPGWAVRIRNTNGSYTFVNARDPLEGSNQASGSSSPVTMAASNLPGGNLITFSTVGQADVAAGTVVKIDITHPLAGTQDRFKCQPTGEIRCLRVEVTPSGQARMCDPAVTDAKDTRYCTP